MATLMGGMGRTFDGGYAEYTVVPRRQVIPFRSTLPWNIIGAVPETLQTAYGSLTIGLDLQRGQSLLIRGGTSSVGLAAAAIAKDLGATVLSTTRQLDRLPRGVRLTAYGGGSGDLPADVLQRYLDRLAGGDVSLGPVHVYALEQIRQAHADMEQNRTFGKVVVTISP